MTKPKRPKYENVQYKPPTPEVFGNAAPVDLPTTGPKPASSSFSVDRPRNKPRLQDRLALYEDDNPRCQQILCIAGIFLPPVLWLVGAVMYLRTPASKVMTREAGLKNLILAVVGLVFIIAYLLYHVFVERESWLAGAATPKPKPGKP
mmetsp:Transcript_83372/g.236280  ORF Transcript_83372/g.236280 Transcript_83372/m.236280 type:complete len:148 (+) Transcript_83372:76-519(+)